MPKKSKPKTAFLFYVWDFKEEQRKKGFNYSNMSSLTNAAGKIWPTVSPQVRAKYEALANKEKEKYKTKAKSTSPAVLVDHTEQEIKNFVRLRIESNSIQKDHMFCMDVNCYCEVRGEYMVGECSVVRFNLADGVIDDYHVVIQADGHPLGYYYDVSVSSKLLGLQMPDKDAPPTNYRGIFDNLMKHLKFEGSTSSGSPPPIFTMPDKVAPVKNFLDQLCRSADVGAPLFRVHRLDALYYNMATALQAASFSRQALALEQLEKDSFQYSSELACPMHDQGEKPLECSKSRAQRWAFTVLDTCCPLVGVSREPGRHRPADYASIDSVTEDKVINPPSAGAAGSSGVTEDKVLNPPSAGAAGSSGVTEDKVLNPPSSGAAGSSGRRKLRKKFSKMKM